MDLPILDLLEKVLEVSGITDKIARNEQVIKLKKHFGLEELEELVKFEDVYAYAVVAYALNEEGKPKPRPLVALFKMKEMRETFAAAYRENKPGDWVEKGQKIAQYQLGEQLPQIDPMQELGIFAAVFFEVLNATKSPKDIQLEQKINSIQQTTTELAQKQQLTLEAINQKVNQLAGAEKPALPAAAKNSNAADLAHRLGEWFEVLEYNRVPDYEVWETDYFEWAIDFPAGRRRVSRTLVRGVAGEVEMSDVTAFAASIKQENADEGWLVGNRRVSKAARQAVEKEETYKNILCYTFDELLDEDADFSKYLNWLEGEIKKKGVDVGYLPLACRKDDINPLTQQKMGVSTYGEEDGWIDGYVDMWLDDPAKEHLSVLGEFGTGKTWFALHYANIALQRYRAAKSKGTERPRIPVVVPLRDYAKAVSVESLFSEFFFRKHEILKNYSVFEQLNRMGKLLLIFDGFDEMAARVDRQAMIDNFWELARVVVPGAKAILTCRTEHFPDAITGRRLLDAELESSTVNLTGETPQFEVLELEKLNDEQIAELIGRQATPETVQAVMGNSQLLDLARRPVMVDLIIGALPDIEAGKLIDMARVYLYAVTRKMQKDIRSERTFTSLADKLYFLCELSWKMISTNQMTLNYRAFPEELQQMFADRVKDEKELDHWRYDMMGQTILIRNAEGDYSPAHRSLLEFFVAYKIVASLGAMAEDFTAIAQEQSHLEGALSRANYTWDSYFKRDCDEQGTPIKIAGLAQFESIGMDALLPMLGQSKLAKAVLDLAHPMLDTATMRSQLLPLLQATAQRKLGEVGYLGGNVAQLMLAQTPHALVNSDLSGAKLQGIDFSKAYLRRVNLQAVQLTETFFSTILGIVFAIAYSPDGTRLAIGDSESILQVWDITTSQWVLFCSGHSAMISSVVYSPDGVQLASASFDNTVKLWNHRTGQCERTLQGHINSVQSVVYSPDGMQLASASADSTIKLWNVDSGECEQTLQGHTNSVQSVVYSPDGAQLASASADNTIKLWNVDSGECEQTLQGHTNSVQSVVYSPGGAQLASASYDKTVKLWDRQTGWCEHTLQEHTNEVWSVIYSPDGAQLASASLDKTVKLWNRHSRRCEHTLQSRNSEEFLSVIYSPDGAQLASISVYEAVKLWDVDSRKCGRTLQAHSNGILSVVYSPDGMQLASASDDKTVKLWNRQTGQCEHTLQGHANVVPSVVYSPDGAQLASASLDTTVKLWNRQTGRCERTLQGHTNAISSVVYSPDGAQLASASDDKTVKLWNRQTGRCERTLEGHENDIWSVVYSPDGTQLASTSLDKTVKLWNRQTGQCERTLQGHTNSVLSVVYSPDGAQLASASDDKTVKLWNRQTGQCERTFQGHTNSVLSIVYSPDGAQLASASTDKTVKLWDRQTGKCERTLQSHKSKVWSIVYSPDGTQLASASTDSSIKLWNADSGKCICTLDDRVCAGLNITSTVGLTLVQRTILKLMGAVEHTENTLS